MWHAARLLTGGPAVIVEPTFGEYAAAVRGAGNTAIAWRAEAPLFTPDLTAITQAAHKAHAQSIWLCSPNNPTGSRIPADTLAAWAQAHPRFTWVIDQSFVSLSTHPEDAAIPMPDNVVCLRSLTKDHALAGLRVGYILAAPQFIARFEATRAPWSCSTPAQAAIRAACNSPQFVKRTRRHLLSDREALRHALAERFGLVASDGAVPFFLVPVPNATAVRTTLLQRWHILVRDCRSFGLPDVLRLAARPEPCRLRLIESLEAVLP
jgi:histidinol-phosphate/aromatic aminotransferase/cobyric acid decarboxylase-like protein